MKIKDLAEKLKQYNPDADVKIIVHNMAEEFTVVFGGAEGEGKEKCREVGFYVDRLCDSEAAPSPAGGKDGE